MAQVTESRDAFRDADAHLAYHKRVMDLYTSRWFGNEPTKKLDSAVEFIRNNSTRAWLKQLDPDEWLAGLQSRPPEQAQFDAFRVAKTASDAVQSKTFFHWELEFPEVFFAPSQPGGQDVQLLEDGGFDVVVGNPPYGATEILPDFSDLHTDLFVYFWALLFKYTSSGGYGSFITPSAWLTGSSYLAMREMILDKGQIHRVIVLPYDVFPDAYIDTCIAIISNSLTIEDFTVQVRHMSKREEGENIWSLELESIELKAWKDELQKRFLLNRDVLQLGRFYHLPEYYHMADIIRIERGVQPYGRQKHTDEEIRNDFLRVASIPKGTNRVYYPELLGEELSRYEIFPEKRNFLEYSDRLASKREEAMFNGERVVLRRLLNRRRQLMSAVTDERLITTDNVINILILHDKLRPAFISALLNSSFVAWLYTNQSAISVKDDFPQITLSEVGYLPIRHINFITHPNEREGVVNAITDLYSRGDRGETLAYAKAMLATGQTDIVHDVLAYLAQTMIDLNKQKQAEVRRFLGWLEGQLKITPKNGAGGLDSLNGKTILQGYLGDYQKGEPELPWDDFYYRLHQNRSRFKANLAQIKGQIQAEYEQSLAVLRPIKQQLAATDALIDQIVYQLYGLSDEEIELIERPAYEQALSEAKDKVLNDKTLQKDPDAAAEAIAQNILPAAQRLQSRVNTTPEEAQLTADLPGWHLFGGDVPTFLLTGEYNIAHLPDHLDFSTSIIGYTKAVEQAIMQRIFAPFRAAGYTAADCQNVVLQGYMAGKKKLTLGNFAFIFTSQEKALRAFADKQYPGQGQALFFDKSNGVRALLNDQASLDLRNKAAHAELLSKEDARNGRDWALAILKFL